MTVHAVQATPETARQRLLAEAMKITAVDRNKAYGSPEDNFTNIANLWNAYFAAQGHVTPVTNARDVANLMILMKVARLATNLNHRDSLLDVAGYAACGADCQEAEAVRRGPQIRNDMVADGAVTSAFKS